MKSERWKLYWKSSEKSFIERKIQLYKVKKGYGRLLQAVPEIREDGRVLEVGAGKAWMSQILRSRGWHTTALDLDQALVKTNSSKIEQYIVGDMLHLPFQNKSFDLVISCGLIEHFTLGTVRSIVSEMNRVGSLVIAWLPTCGPAWKLVWTLRNLLGSDVFIESYRHQRKDLENIFVSLGFQDVRSGVVKYGGLLHYIYIYGTSLMPVRELSTLSQVG